MLVIGRLLAIALLVAPAADAAVLTAEAGLDGVGRPGRWLPVRVTIDARTDDVDGDLIADWGRARVRRAVVLAAPSRRTVDLYLRTGDVRDEVVVRLEDHGREVARLVVPLRIAGVDQRTVATVSAGHRPSSWRGYDVADEVTFESGEPPAGSSESNALSLWRGLRRAGDIDRALPAAEPVGNARTAVSYAGVTALLYVSALGAAAFLFGPSRSRALLAYGTVGALILAGATAAWATGRSSAVVIRQQGVAEQFEGAAQTLLSMRATAQFPADGAFVLRAQTADGVIDRVSGPFEDDTRLDADGRPTIAVRAAIGSTASFTVDAVSEFRAFSLTRDGSMARITNATGATLDRCEFPADVVAPPARLEPGQSVDVPGAWRDADPILACRLSGSPLEFSETHHAVTTIGATLVVYHFAGARQ